MIPGAFGVHHPGAVRVGRVSAYYMDEGLGELVCNVVDTYGGVHNQCRILTPGGGNKDNFELIPPAIDESGEVLEQAGEVLLALGDGIRPHPYVLGTIYRASVGTQLSTDAGDEDGDEEDYAEKSSVRDRITKFAGIRMVFSHGGSWLLDLSQTDKPARFQLGSLSFMRISQQDGATEFVLLGDQTLKHLRQLHARIDQLADAIKGNGSSIDSIKGVLTGATCTSGGVVEAGALAPVSGEDPTVSPANDYPFSFEHEASALQGDATQPDFDGGSEHYKAACFRISNWSHQDQLDNGGT